MQNLQLQADKFLSQGNLTQAIQCYRQMPFSPKRDAQIKDCLQKMARKYWRQDKPLEFLKVMIELKAKAQLALAHAALSGKEAMTQLAKSQEGVLSELAFCRIQSDLKLALLALRKISGFKEFAEGWIAILKGDSQRALNSFHGDSVYARVGRGIVFLLQGDRKEAEKLLEGLRPFAVKRFPVLGKIMEWNQSLQKISLDLLHAPFEKLLAAESGTVSDQVKGWLALRRGDQIFSSDEVEADRLWSLAEKRYPSLHLDLLKRRFLCGLYSKESHSAIKPFFKLYRFLLRTCPKDAKTFLECLALDCNRQVLVRLAHQDLWDVRKGWVIDPPPIELQFLWLFLFAKNSAEQLSRLVLFPSVMPESVILMSWEKWDVFFRTLDLEYGSQESYHLWKLAVLQIFRKPRPICDAISQLLIMNPHLGDQWIPLYVQQCFKVDIAERAELYSQIEKIQRCFPANFDLIRLALWTQSNSQQSIFSYQTQLSEPLYKVLQFQHLLDLGWGMAKVKKYSLPNEMLLKSKEADWRFLAALCSSEFYVSKKDPENVLNRIACEKDTFEILQRLALYGISAPCSTLKKRMNRNKKDWRPYYYLALYYAQKGDREQCMENLLMANEWVPFGVPEAASIEITLRFCETREGFDAVDSLQVQDFMEVLNKLFGGNFER